MIPRLRRNHTASLCSPCRLANWEVGGGYLWVCPQTSAFRHGGIALEAVSHNSLVPTGVGKSALTMQFMYSEVRHGFSLGFILFIAFRIRHLTHVFSAVCGGL